MPSSQALPGYLLHKPVNFPPVLTVWQQNQTNKKVIHMLDINNEDKSNSVLMARASPERRYGEL